jgi:hypothetical protein
LTVEEGLNNFITSAVWGKEENNEWKWISTEPQLKKPVADPNVTTYFKYLEKKIVKEPKDRTELKKQTCRFIYSQHGAKFREFFDLYLKQLAFNEIENIKFPNEADTNGSSINRNSIASETNL